MMRQPKHVRNFWCEVLADGRENVMSTGPATITGGMRIQVTQRSHGKVVPAFTIRCIANGELLQTVIKGQDGNEIAYFETER